VPRASFAKCRVRSRRTNSLTVVSTTPLPPLLVAQVSCGLSAGVSQLVKLSSLATDQLKHLGLHLSSSRFHTPFRLWRFGPRLRSCVHTLNCARPERVQTPQKSLLLGWGGPVERILSKRNANPPAGLKFHAECSLRSADPAESCTFASAN
jgi:hypothetical protein